MELTELKTSDAIMNGSERVARLREDLNRVYSQAPQELDEVFEAALDQVVDQQLRIAQAFTRLIATEDVAEAESTIKTAIAEAQRSALRAARAYADSQSVYAETVSAELANLAVNIGQVDIVARKRPLDDRFKDGITRHEKDDVAAFPLLITVAGEYNNWCLDARVAITGSRGFVAVDRKKVRLQWAAIGIAFAIGFLSITLNIILFLARK